MSWGWRPARVLRPDRIMFGGRGLEPGQETLVGRKTADDDYWREIGPALGLRTPSEIDAFRHRYFADEASPTEGCAYQCRRARPDPPTAWPLQASRPLQLTAEAWASMAGPMLGGRFWIC